MTAPAISPDPMAFWAGGAPLERRLRALGKEFSVATDPGIQGGLSAQMARLSLATGDLTGAAKHAVAAANGRPDALGPLETLVAVAYLKRAPGTVPQVLGRVIAGQHSQLNRARAAFELLAHWLRLDGREIAQENVLLFSDALDGSSERLGSAALLREVVSSALGREADAAAATLLRAGHAESPQVRASLLRRAGRGFWGTGDSVRALSCFADAQATAPSRAGRRELERAARACEASDVSVAAARAAADSATSSTERALLLTLAVTAALRGGDMQLARDLAREIPQVVPSDASAHGPRAAVAWLTGDRSELWDAFRAALPGIPIQEQAPSRLVELLTDQQLPGVDAIQTFRALAVHLPEGELRRAIEGGLVLRHQAESQALLGDFAAILRAAGVSPQFERAAELLELRAAAQSDKKFTIPHRPRATRGWPESFSLSARIAGQKTADEELDALLLPETLARVLFEFLRGGGTSRTLDPQIGLTHLSPTDRLAFDLRGFSLRIQNHDAESLTQLLRPWMKQSAGDPFLAGAFTALTSGQEKARALLQLASTAEDPNLGAAWALTAYLTWAQMGDRQSAELALRTALEVSPACLDGAERWLFPSTGIAGPPHGELNSLRELAEQLTRTSTETLPPFSQEATHRSLTLFHAALAIAGKQVERTSELLTTSGYGPSEVLPTAVAVAADAGDLRASLELSQRWMDAAPCPEAAFLELCASHENQVAPRAVATEALHAACPPSEADAWGQAERLVSQGDLEAGILALESALGAGGSDSQTTERLAWEVARAYAMVGQAAKGAGPDDLYQTALAIFQRLEEAQPRDPSVQMGLLVCAEALGESLIEANALHGLAGRTERPEDAAEIWERIGVLREERLGDKAGALEAFQAALTLDRKRLLSFRRLYAEAQVRGDDQRQVDLLDLGLEMDDLSGRKAILLWEKTRLCRKLGRRGAALHALEQLLEIEPSHWPALAGLAEMHLMDGRKSNAAAVLARLARGQAAPLRERTILGLQAAQIYNDLGQHETALELLQELKRAGAPDLDLRRTLAQAAARSGHWREAYDAFLAENDHADNIEDRKQSARLMLAIQRDHLKVPSEMADSVRRVLRDEPDNGEAADVAIELNMSADELRVLLAPAIARARSDLLQNPLDTTLIARLCRLAERGGDWGSHVAARGLLELTGISPSDGQKDSGMKVPTGTLSPQDLFLILPERVQESDWAIIMAVSRLIQKLTEPSMEDLGISPLLRVGSASDHELYGQLSPWAQAFGLAAWDLYVGGQDPAAAYVLQGARPACIMGATHRAPLGERTSALLAAELYLAQMGALALAALPASECELWIEAARAAILEAAAPPELVDRTRAVSSLLNSNQRQELSELWQAMEARGVSASTLHIWVRTAACRALLVVHGDAAVLRYASAFIPDEAGPRTIVLGDCVRFAFSSELGRLRRKIGLG